MRVVSFQAAEAAAQFGSVWCAQADGSVREHLGSEPPPMAFGARYRDAVEAAAASVSPGGLVHASGEFRLPEGTPAPGQAVFVVETDALLERGVSLHPAAVAEVSLGEPPAHMAGRVDLVAVSVRLTDPAGTRVRVRHDAAGAPYFRRVDGLEGVSVFASLAEAERRADGVAARLASLGDWRSRLRG